MSGVGVFRLVHCCVDRGFLKLNENKKTQINLKSVTDSLRL